MIASATTKLPITLIRFDRPCVCNFRYTPTSSGSSLRYTPDSLQSLFDSSRTYSPAKLQQWRASYCPAPEIRRNRLARLPDDCDTGRREASLSITGQRRSDQRVGHLPRHDRRGHPIGQGSVHHDAVPEEHVVIVEIGGE